MNVGISGINLVDTYAEALDKMPSNPGIPQLFRDIFKNASLPYRDPETLRAFLKIIDDFSYDHSEKLGDAFEYLLSSLGTQGDAGQFRTPRPIIDFMTALVDPKKTDVISDPACGTGGFLISSFRHVVRANADADGANMLSPLERETLASNLRGYDISPDMVRLSLVNMYLHGFSNPQIFEYDTLTNEERWNEYSDVILANPPFMTPKGGIRPHKRFTIQVKKSETLFVDYIAEHLTENGRAAVIVPEGVLERADKAHEALRSLLVKDYLSGIVSLPGRLFLPYAKVKTSIILLDRKMAKSGAPVFYSEVNQVGFSLDSAHNPVEENDLPRVIKDYVAHRNGHELSAASWHVDRAQILAKKSLLSAAEFKPRKVSGRFPFRRLGDICKIEKGQSSSTTTAPGEYPLVLRSEDFESSATFEFTGPAVCVPTLSLAHGEKQIKRVHYVEGKYGVANLLAVVQPLDPSVVNAKYLFLVLDREKDAIASLMKGTAHVTLKINDLASFAIPVPPINVQEAVVEKYEVVLRARSEAKAVIGAAEADLLSAVDGLLD
jgi:type I restriction enzyme M protein